MNIRAAFKRVIDEYAEEQRHVSKLLRMDIGGSEKRRLESRAFVLDDLLNELQIKLEKQCR